MATKTKEKRTRTKALSDGRKIPCEYENPIDNLLIDWSQFINPYLHEIYVVPNVLTACSFAFGLLAAYLTYKSKFALAALSFIVAYVFDCMDGNMARMFDQVTVFGDYFDHITDVIQFICLGLCLLFNKDITRNTKIVFVILSIILFALMDIHIGCQEAVYERPNESSTLSWLTRVCPVPAHTYIRYTRYFGPGTLNCLIFLFLLYLAHTTHPNNKRKYDKYKTKLGL